MPITFTSIKDAHEFATTQAGQDLIANEYAGEEYIHGACGQPVRLRTYVTPQAAALAALVVGDWHHSLKRYSVTSLYREGGSTTCVSYAATLEHDDDYTHTDEDGFLKFLNNNDWQDMDWQQRVIN